MRFTGCGWLLAGFLPLLFGAAPVFGQIDPVKRELIQLGYNQPVEGKSPIAGYAFFYYNRPDFLDNSNLTLRVALAPVYLDSELGISGALTPHTDIGIGLAGGGFADSYYEVRRGQYLQSESFDGNGGTVSASIYHLFDPDALIPLNGVLRGEAHFADYVRNDSTASTFILPRNGPSYNIRTGLRLGGREPVMISDVALELSVWYEAQFRQNSGAYGFPVAGVIGDRNVNPVSHLYWTRALFAYTFGESKHNFQLSVTAGGSDHPDRFSAYRLGGFLPLASEFPLILPGYYYQEISAERFVLFNGNYSFPLDSKGRWAVNAVASSANVDYLSGEDQPGHWNSGVGGGITYRSTSGAWQVMLDYGHGFNAIRDSGRGADSVGILIQFNLVRTKSEYYNPGDSIFLRGMDRFLHSFD